MTETPPTEGAIQLRCPECNRHLAHCGEFGQAVCSNCGCRVTFESKQWRRRLATGAKPSQ